MGSINATTPRAGVQTSSDVEDKPQTAPTSSGAPPTSTENRGWLKGTNQQAINHYLTPGTSWSAASARAHRDGVSLKAAVAHPASPVSVEAARRTPAASSNTSAPGGLKKGDRTPQVTELQSALSDIGFTVTPDGVYGKQTADGVVGYEARRAAPGDSDGTTVSPELFKKIVQEKKDRALLGPLVTGLTDELLLKAPETLKAMRASAAQIRHLDTDEAKRGALNKVMPEHLAKLEQLVASKTLSPEAAARVAELKKHLETAINDGTIVDKTETIDGLYRDAVGSSMDRAVEDFTTGLGKTNPALLKTIGDEVTKLSSIEDPKSALDRIEGGLQKLDALVANQPNLSPAARNAWALLKTRLDTSIKADRQSARGPESSSVANLAKLADKSFDKSVEGMLNEEGSGKVLDSKRRLPESKADYMRISKRIHEQLGIAGNSTALTPHQVDQAFELVAKEFGVRPEFLKYMAKTESGLKQRADNGAAFGMMQIERVHKDAYVGATNVKNDTITNMVYGGLLRAQTDRTMALRFEQAGLTPPNNPRVVEFLGDLAYNRGPGLLKYVANYAAEQKIDVNKFAEYVAGRGGTFKIVDGGRRIVVYPKDDKNIDHTGRNSVLAKSSEAVGRVKFSAKLQKSLGDRNGDGRIDHLDVWLTRGVRYLKEVT